MACSHLCHRNDEQREKCGCSRRFEAAKVDLPADESGTGARQNRREGRNEACVFASTPRTSLPLIDSWQRIRRLSGEQRKRTLNLTFRNTDFPDVRPAICPDVGVETCVDEKPAILYRRLGRVISAYRDEPFGDHRPRTLPNGYSNTRSTGTTVTCSGFTLMRYAWMAASSSRISFGFGEL